MKVDDARGVLDLCRKRFVLVTRDGENVRIRPIFPEDYPVPDDIIEQVRDHKPAILVILNYEEYADELVLESSRRIGTGWTPGCSLDSPEWDAHEKALHEAYWLGDLDRLEDVLRRREDYAFEVFNHYRTEVSDDPSN